MENIIKKLKQNKDKHGLHSWSLEEKKQLLDIYYIISKKETHIFELIYSYQGCDSWEDIFRDYDVIYLRDKAIGVKAAIDEMNEADDEDKVEDKEEQIKSENHK